MTVTLLPGPKSVGATVVNCVEEAARYMATEPRSVQGVLDCHLPGADGRCIACRGPGRWPCVLVTIARHAAGLTTTRVHEWSHRRG